MQPPAKSLKIFDRSNRRFIGEVVIKDGRFTLVRGPENKSLHSPAGYSGGWENKETGAEIEEQIWEITAKKPRLVYAAEKKDGGIEDFFGNLPLEAKEENFGILGQELSIFFPLLRFIEISNLGDEGPLRDELKNKVLEAFYLSPNEKEELKKEIEKADTNELALISDDLKILERFAKLRDLRQ